MTSFEKFVKWDSQTWSRSVKFWYDEIEKHKFCLDQGLEIGARDGELTLFFTSKYQSKIYCSDVGFPTAYAKALHQQSGFQNLISYHDVNVSAIPFPDNSFDFVFFKSVMGAVGRNRNFAAQEKAFKEMHRVLKTGGVLFFAENLKGTWLHSFGRRRLVPWGSSWRYMTLSEIDHCLKPFDCKAIRSTGFLAAFLSESMKVRKNIAQFDYIIQPIIPESWRYVSFGWATK